MDMPKRRFLKKSKIIPKRPLSKAFEYECFLIFLIRKGPPATSSQALLSQVAARRLTRRNKSPLGLFHCKREMPRKQPSNCWQSFCEALLKISDVRMFNGFSECHWSHGSQSSQSRHLFGDLCLDVVFSQKEDAHEES